MVNYWLWVTRDGGMPTTVDEKDMKDWGWEGCDEETKKGDKVLIYLTNPHKCIKYLAEITEDAEEATINTKKGLKDGYICEFDILHEFKDPLKIGDMKENTDLEDWYPLKMSFVRMIFPIDEKYWLDLKRILTEEKENPEASKFF